MGVLGDLLAALTGQTQPAPEAQVAQPQAAAPTTAVPVTQPAAQPPMHQGLLSSLLGPEYTPNLRAFGAGLGNLQHTNDMAVSIGQGFSGAQNYFQTQEDKNKQLALDAQKTDYQRQQDEIKNRMDQQKLALDQQNSETSRSVSIAANKRAEEQAKVEKIKSAYELKQISDEEGIPLVVLSDFQKNATKAASDATRRSGSGTDFSIDDATPFDRQKYSDAFDESMRKQMESYNSRGKSSEKAAPAAVDPAKTGFKIINGVKTFNGEPI